MAWTRKSIAPQLAAELREDRIDGREILDVAGDDESAADLLGKRLDPPPEGFALVGEGELGAMTMERLGDAPGDRVIVRHAHDQAAPALHDLARQFAHVPVRSRSP